MSGRYLNQSGRPDLNRGPPAPKAGAIPGYATPRRDRNLLYPASSAQRAQECAKRATAVAVPGCGFDTRFGECPTEICCLEVGIVSETAFPTWTLQDAPFNFPAPHLLARRILESGD